jgi:hypothetical protein
MRGYTLPLKDLANRHQIAERRIYRTSHQYLINFNPCNILDPYYIIR